MRAPPPMRILVSETMDPDGAMYRWLSPDAELLGHTALPFPTQEALPLLGPDGLRAAFLAVARELQPTLVVVHPPYDHLDRQTLVALEDTGAALVAFAFDEPLFATARARPGVSATFHAAARAFDRYAVTDSGAVPALLGASVPARLVRFAASLEPFEEVAEPPVDVASRAVLVGRAYPKRVALVRAVSARGVPIDVFGHGWRDDDFGPSVRVHGPLTRPQMNAVYQRAGVVITTADWEDAPVPMVKYRLLEVAFAGGAQLAQASPDLTTYFRPDEVPSWGDANGLADLCRAVLARPTLRRSLARKAQLRALAEHRWKTRLSELVDGLPLARADGGEDAPHSWRALMATLAHDAERRGAQRLATALFEAWHARAPNATAHAGLGRMALAAHRPPPLWAPALAAPDGPGVGLYAVLPAPAIGPGLGRVGYLDPTPERAAFELASLIDVGHLDTARALLASARFDDPDLVVAVAAILEPAGPPAAAHLWKELYRRALLASPTQRLDLKEAHRDQWRAYLGPDAPPQGLDAALKKDGSLSPEPPPERAHMQ